MAVTTIPIGASLVSHEPVGDVGQFVGFNFSSNFIVQNQGKYVGIEVASNIPVGAGIPVPVGSTLQEGVAVTFARSDHVHTADASFVSYTPASPGSWPSIPSTVAQGLDNLISYRVVRSDINPVDIGAAASPGISSLVSRSDHVHPPVNLGSSSVTGTLPRTAQQAQSMGGDVSGTTANALVVGLNGEPLDIVTAPSAENSLVYNGVLWMPSKVLLTSAAGVTGTLPAANQASQSMGGDVSGTTASATVTKLQGRSVANTAPSADQPLVYSAGSWTPGALNLAGGASVVSGTLPAANQASQSMGGDVSGTTASATVTKLQGRAMANTAPSTDQPLVYSAGAWTPGALNLAGGASVVTGVLPAGNQASQSLGGDLSGTTASGTVAKLQTYTLDLSTAPTDGQVLQYQGVLGGNKWKAVTLPVSQTSYTPNDANDYPIGSTPTTPSAALDNIADRISRPARHSIVHRAAIQATTGNNQLGNNTVSCYYRMKQRVPILGIRFFYFATGTTALILKASLWRQDTQVRLTSVNVNVQRFGVYEGYFASPITTDLTGTDIVVSLWETTAARYLNWTDATLQSQIGTLGYEVDPVLRITAIDKYSAGDNFPSSSAATERYSFIEPIVWIP